MDPDPAEAADAHLCRAIAAAHDGNLNLASSEATKALACLGLDSAFSVTVHRAEDAPPPEPAASERVFWRNNYLYVDGRHLPRVGRSLSGDGWCVFCIGGPDNLPDERTARAVLLAMVGEDPGVTVALSLRDSWTREDVDRAKAAGLGHCVALLLKGYAKGYDGHGYIGRPDDIRAWVEHGQGLMTLRVVDGGADVCPF